MKLSLNKFLIVLLILTNNLVQAELIISAAPSWVVNHQPEFDFGNKKEYGSSYIMFDQQLFMTEKSKFDYNRIVVKINNSQGLREMGELSVSFDPIYNTVKFHHVNIIRKDKVINVLENVDFKIIRQENDIDNGIYNGKETALLFIEDLQVDDVIDYSFTIQGKNPIFKNQIFEYFGLEWSTPVEDLYISISIPKSKTIEYNMHKGNTRPNKIIKDNRINYSWHFNQIKAVDFQGNYPNWYMPFNFLELTEFKNWKQVAQWASEVFTIDLTLGNDIKSMIASWESSNKDTQGKVMDALNFVQNEIRYLGVEIGINSHKPRPPSDTFNTKYGDCKDKTMLLHAMLKEMNIDSSPLLVSTDLNNGILDRLPNPGLFNHVILQVEINGKLYWVDPTITDQGNSLKTIGLPDFGVGLVVSNLTKKLTPITRISSQVNHKVTHEKITANKNKEKDILEVKTQFFGHFAEYWRTSLKANSHEKIQKNFESYTTQLYGPVVTNQKLKSSDDLEENKITVNESYKLLNPWKQNNNFEYIELFAYSLLDYLELPNRINRNTPIALNFPLRVEHQISINYFSKDLEYEDKPFESISEYMKYKKHVSQNEKIITITHQLEILKDHVPSENLQKHYRQIKQIKKNLTSVLGLSIQKKARLKETNNKLKSILQKMIKEKSNESN
ncbi:MAG: DUF3857 domain-containing transglutaminase family protein [Marinicellaceae bacterium]